MSKRVSREMEMFNSKKPQSNFQLSILELFLLGLISCIIPRYEFLQPLIVDAPINIVITVDPEEILDAFATYRTSGKNNNTANVSPLVCIRPTSLHAIEGYLAEVTLRLTSSQIHPSHAPPYPLFFI